MKIVSLLPSATEIVCRLGLESNLVGISHECDFPGSVADRPRLTRSRVNPQAASGEIHRTVQDLLRQSLSVYDLDLDRLQSLNPDFVVTQDLCDVCAIPFQQVEDACRTFLGKTVQVLSLRPQRLEDIWNDIARVAEALDRQPACREFHQEVDRRVASVREKIQSRNPSPKRVLTLEWLDPVMIGGMWVPEMIEIAGGLPLLAESGKPAAPVTREELKTVDPERVVVKPCGFKLQQTWDEWETLKQAAPWETWTAGRTGHVFLVDGNAYFNRPGPRILESLEILAACTHPELFPETFQDYGKDFIRVSEEWAGG